MLVSEVGLVYEQVIGCTTDLWYDRAAIRQIPDGVERMLSHSWPVPATTTLLCGVLLQSAIAPLDTEKGTAVGGPDF